MLHVISNPDYVALDLSVAADSKSASRSKIKLRQSVIDAVACVGAEIIRVAVEHSQGRRVGGPQPTPSHNRAAVGIHGRCRRHPRGVDGGDRPADNAPGLSALS